MFKKLFFALFITTAAQALANFSCPPPVYIEGSLGYAYSNWSDVINYLFPRSESSINIRCLKNPKSSFAIGGAVGYQYTPNLAVEAGAFSLPIDVKFSITSGDVKDVGTISNWFMYCAGKVNFPISCCFDAFGKIGIAYRGGKFHDRETTSDAPNKVLLTSVSGYFDPIVGGGLQYHLNSHLSINGQYLFMPYGILATNHIGPNREDHPAIPSAQLVTAGIAYQF